LAIPVLDFYKGSTQFLRKIFGSTRQNGERYSVQGESATRGNAISRHGIQDGNAIANVRLVQGIRVERTGSMWRDRLHHSKGSQLDARAVLSTGKSAQQKHN